MRGRTWLIVACAVVIASVALLRSCEDEPRVEETSERAAAVEDPEPAQPRRPRRPRRDAGDAPGAEAPADVTPVEEAAVEAPVGKGRIVVTARRPDGTVELAALLLFVADDAKTLARAEMNDESEGRTELVLPLGSAGRVVLYSFVGAPWVSEPMVVEAEETTLHVDLEAGLEIAGIVIAHDGVTPAAGVSLQAWATPAIPDLDEGPPVRFATTGPDGRFVLRGFGPGRASITADPYGRRELGAKAGAMAAAGDRDVRIQLRRQVAVRFVPVDSATGKAPRTLYMEVVEVTKDGEQVRSTYANNSLPDPADVPEATALGHEVVLHRAETHRFRFRAQGYFDSDPIDVDPSEGPVARTIRVELRPDPGGIATLILRVVDPDGPVPSMVVVTRHNGGGWMSSGCKLEGGVIALPFPPGPLVLSVGSSPNGGDLSMPWFPERLELDLPRGSSVTRTVVLRRGGFLRIRGTKEESAPRPERVLSGEKALEVHFAPKHDEQGFLQLAGPLEAGEYVAEFEVGDEIVKRPFTIVVGEVAEISLVTER